MGRLLSRSRAAVSFVVNPMQTLVARTQSPAEEGLPDEERRHEEVLAAQPARRRAGIGVMGLRGFEGGTAS